MPPRVVIHYDDNLEMLQKRTARCRSDITLDAHSCIASTGFQLNFTNDHLNQLQHRDLIWKSPSSVSEDFAWFVHLLLFVFAVLCVSFRFVDLFFWTRNRTVPSKRKKK